MNYIEVTPEEQQELLKKINVIQKEQQELYHKCRQVVDDWRLKDIPWYYRVYMVFVHNHKYRKEEDEAHLAWFKLNFSSNPSVFDQTRLDIMNNDGRNMWIPCELYRKLMEDNQ